MVILFKIPDDGLIAVKSTSDFCGDLAYAVLLAGITWAVPINLNVVWELSGDFLSMIIMRGLCSGDKFIGNLRKFLGILKLILLVGDGPLSSSRNILS